MIAGRRLVERWRRLSRRGRIRLVAAVVLGLPAAVLLLLALARSGLEAPAPTLLVTDRAGRFLGELPAPGDERLGFWPVEQVPPRVAAATIAIEDRRFRSHPGVDPLAIARAVRQNFSSGRRVSGASTLAMQVARMQRPGARGWLRKAVEGATAVALTLRHGRDGVLRHYLRVVPYGHRIHGIGYAARRYLDKPVDDLSWAEVAFLAAIPQSPARMDPYDPRGRVRAIARAGAILDRLAARGEIPEVELAAARAELATLRLPWRAARPEAALHPLLAIDRRLPPGRRESAPRVATTLDLELQQEVQWLAWKAVDEAADRGAGNAAVMVVERDGWKVAAAVGSTGYFDATRAGAIDFLAEPRSSGSTLKPLLYALALERGLIAPNTILDDLGPGPGAIVNADGRFLGPMLPRTALANSRNVPAVTLLARLGLDPFYAALGDLGLHAQERPSVDYGLGLAIGSLPVTLERLVGAYTALAGDGRRFEPAWLDGEAATARERFVTEATARRITQFLADPQARLPSFPRLGFSEYPFPVAVKTGTSSRFRDAWTVAWSERYLVGVWVGHPDARAMSRLTGYRIAARLAQSVLEHLHADELDGLAGAPFPPPRGAHAERLCALSGARATAACDRVAIEWVDDGEVLPDCGAHRLLAFDRRSGRPASGATPASEIEARTVVDLPSRYAGWLERQRMTALPEGPGDPLATAAAGEPVIEIVSPEPGSRLFLDPEVPASRNTLRLAAVVEPAIEQLVWYVDGVPFATVDRPYAARWPLAPGEHVVQARAPYSGARSRAVRIVVE